MSLSSTTFNRDAKITGAEAEFSAEPIEKAAERVGKELRIFVDAPGCLGPIHSQLKPGGEGHVVFVIPRGASRDFEVDLPGRYRLTAEMANAVKAMSGVVDVRLS